MNSKTKKYENSCQIINTNFKNSSISLYLINKNILVSAFPSFNTINFYDLKNNKIDLIISMKNIECSYGNKIFCIINNNTLIVGGRDMKGFYLINIKNYKLLGNINEYNIREIYTIIKLKNKNNIIVGISTEDWSSNVNEFKVDNNKFIKIKEIKHAFNEGEVYGIVELNDEKICYGAYYGNAVILK